MGKEPIDAKLADVWSIGVILFTMVCKAMPFDPEIMKLMIRRKFVQLRFPSKPQVSGPLKDLLAAFLQFLPDSRIPLNNVERHPWYSERQSQSLVPEDEVIVRGILERQPENYWWRTVI